MPTIADVAARAGVALSTVSRVINGGYASAAARERVLAAGAALGFAPAAPARTLTRGRSGIVGVAAASSQSPWFVQLLGGMEEALHTHAASVAIASVEREGAANGFGSASSGVYDPGAVHAWIR